MKPNTIQNQNMNKDTYQILKATGESFHSAGRDNETRLVKGQRVIGEVTAVDKDVTLNIRGQELTVSKDSLVNVAVGDKKAFEVMDVSDNVIKLKLIEDTTDINNSINASPKIEKDKDTYFSQKEYSKKQNESEKEFQDIKSKVDEIISNMTDHDYQLLAREGLPVEDFTIDRLYAALKRVKTEEKAAGEEKRTEMVKRGMAIPRNIIEERLKQADLPVTKEITDKVETALNLSDAIERIDSRALRYLIGNELPPTIGNFYKAQYSGSNLKNEEMNNISDKAWKDLLPQAEGVIEDAGYEVNDENRNDAKWLLENNLSLTSDTFSDLKNLKQIIQNTDKDAVFNKIIDGLKNGTAPMEVSLKQDSYIDQKELIDKINSIEDETIDRAVKSNQELSIKKLLDMQQKNETTGDKQDSSQISIEAITARRQLEEIRLKMTAEAAVRLEKKGLHIETESLQKVVEELRGLEDKYYQDYFHEVSGDAAKDQIQLFKETTLSMESLKFTPSYILGQTLADRKTQTIPGLLIAGNQLKSQLEKANASYETLMTTPDREYGDSIQKAFDHIDSMLQELGLDNTESNQRAVRILGYNQMEITAENINQVKAYDMQVNSLIKNLQPAVTIHMIKEGMNPLNIPIYDLNRMIDDISDEQGYTSEEKYSTYLWRLQKEEEIPENERKAYIGIYRLLNNIEKSDGAALGSVIKANKEVTLSNLLTAVRTGKLGGINTKVDDSFGTLESLTFKRENITDQLTVFSENKEESSGSKNSFHKNDQNEEQIEYLNRLLKNMLNEITPDKLSEISNMEANKTFSYQTEEIVQGRNVDPNVWESIKDIEVDLLYEKLQDSRSKEQVTTQENEHNVEELREMIKNSDQEIRFLSGLQMPCTAANITLVNQMFQNGGSLYKKLMKIAKDNEEENSGEGLNNVTDLSDKLVDKDTEIEAYNDLESRVEKILNKAYSEDVIDLKALAELKNIRLQMGLAKTLARKEFYQIPIETGDGNITNLNLTIIRGAKDSGKVSVSVFSEGLGNIQAEYSVKEDVLKGFISCDNRKGLDYIKNNSRIVESAALEEHLEIKQIDYGILKNNRDINMYQTSESDNTEDISSGDTERILYRIAKAFVLTVHASEVQNVKDSELAS